MRRPTACALAGTFLAVGEGLAQPSPAYRPFDQPVRNYQVVGQATRPGTIGYCGISGYVEAASGREFALVGTFTGTWIVETTNPSNPVEKGFFPGPTSLWREISTYQHYAYVVTEGGGGVQILDLANPDAPAFVQTYTLPGWSNTHTVTVDRGAGRLYCNGATAGMEILDLADPVNPAPLATYTSTYVHDSFVQNGRAYLSCTVAGEMRLLDVAALPTLTTISLTATPLASTHNAVADSADALAVSADETGGGWIQLYDVSNPAAPLPLGSDFTPGVVIHGTHLVDDKVLHVTHYTAGLRALDLTDRNAPVEIGHYEPMSAWGSYPFQPSGVIYATDIPPAGGLRILRLSCGVPRRYGAGTAGSGGFVPEIDWDGGHARVGNPTFRLEARRLLGGTFAALAIASAPASVPVLGITLLVSPVPPPVLLLVPVAGAGPGAGTAALTLPIPNDPDLANGTGYAQWIALDPGGPQGFSASAGVEVTLCP
ncbi:MAG: LVIVD repeat-containing protein [Planctomycetota bacterium]